MIINKPYYPKDYPTIPFCLNQIPPEIHGLLMDLIRLPSFTIRSGVACSIYLNDNGQMVSDFDGSINDHEITELIKILTDKNWIIFRGHGFTKNEVFTIFIPSNGKYYKVECKIETVIFHETVLFLGTSSKIIKREKLLMDKMKKIIQLEERQLPKEKIEKHLKCIFGLLQNRSLEMDYQVKNDFLKALRQITQYPQALTILQWFDETSIER